MKYSIALLFFGYMGHIMSTQEPLVSYDAAQNHYSFCRKIKHERFIENHLYHHMVEKLPLCCVDIFIYSFFR